MHRERELQAASVSVSASSTSDLPLRPDRLMQFQRELQARKMGRELEAVRERVTKA